MKDFTASIVTVFTLIIGVAIVAELVSGKSKTVDLVNSVFGGFAKVLNAAVAPAL